MQGVRFRLIQNYANEYNMKYKWFFQPSQRSFSLAVAGSFCCGLLSLALSVFSQPKSVITKFTSSSVYGNFPPDEIKELEEDFEKYNKLWSKNKVKIMKKFKKEYEEFKNNQT